jgi:2'-5' RNA ligase
MAATVRTFLALTLPPAAVSAAAGVLEVLRPRASRGDVKWVAPQNLHMTVRFLGNLSEEDLARARLLTTELHEGFDPVPTAWAQLGAFPSTRRPAVLWLGLDDAQRRLSALAREIGRRLRKAGFGEADKPFRAHVTLGRVRRGRRVDWAALSDGLTTPSEAFSIRNATLFKSTLTSEGPIYTPVARADARASVE